MTTPPDATLVEPTVHLAHPNDGGMTQCNLNELRELDGSMRKEGLTTADDVYSVDCNPCLAAAFVRMRDERDRARNEADELASSVRNLCAAALGVDGDHRLWCLPAVPMLMHLIADRSGLQSKLGHHGVHAPAYPEPEHNDEEEDWDDED